VADIVLKKTCANCIHWKRQETPSTTKMNQRCEIHGFKTPVYGYCLAWAVTGSVITSTMLKKFRMER
jgi:hypothetical protein